MVPAVMALLQQLLASNHAISARLTCVENNQAQPQQQQQQQGGPVAAAALLLLLLLCALLLLLLRLGLIVLHAGQAYRYRMVTRQQLLQQGRLGRCLLQLQRRQVEVGQRLAQTNLPRPTGRPRLLLELCAPLPLPGCRPP